MDSVAHPPVTTIARCAICDEVKEFSSPDAYWSCRELLRSTECAFNSCATRERAAADVLFSLIPRETVREIAVHEPAPCGRGLSLWMRQNCQNIVRSGYFPNHRFGAEVGGLRNENMEAQTFEDSVFDLVIHLDVMEHLFSPFDALNETYRTLKPGGVSIFSTPTYSDRVKSEQVAFMNDGGLSVVGKPEYHGNPQDPSGGSLVTWRYGYDLPKLISERTAFDVEVRRWQSRSKAIAGLMTEVYILRRPA